MILKSHPAYLLAAVSLVAVWVLYFARGNSSLFNYGHALVSNTASSFVSPWRQSSEDRDEYLAICLAVKDQGPDLAEWLQHHYFNMGIKRFYILDDGSEPPMSTFAHTFKVPSEALTFVYYNYNASQRQFGMQHFVYNDCAHVHGVNNTWLAFIDADEFFDTPGPESLEQILRQLEPLRHIGALGVNWQMHTSNGRLTRADSVRKAYTECIYDDPEHNGQNTDNRHIKSIVRTAAYGAPMNPHKFSTLGSITVGEFGDPINTIAFRTPITRERISLHHYAVKSREEYEEKMARSNGMDASKDWEFWNHVENMTHIDCSEMARWVS